LPLHTETETNSSERFLDKIFKEDAEKLDTRFNNDLTGIIEEEVLPRDIPAIIEPEQLAYNFGFESQDWAEWVDDNIDLLANIAQEAVSNAIEDYITDHYDNVMAEIAASIEYYKSR
jgi:hypothetical protein